jgi:hypothetical protein
LLCEHADRAAHRICLGDDIMAVHVRPAAGRPQDGAQHTHRGRLTSTIGAQQSEQLTLLHAQVQIGDGKKVVELFTQSFSFDHPPITPVLYPLRLTPPHANL